LGEGAQCGGLVEVAGEGNLVANLGGAPNKGNGFVVRGLVHDGYGQKGADGVLAGASKWIKAIFCESIWNVTVTV
jgi:hypothetical protein